jgi:hypothetical protein
VPAVSIIDLAAVLPYGGKLVPVVPIDAGKLLPIIQGHGLQRPRWCRVVPAVSIDSREGGADHRPGCAVLPCCR